ncbi:hypothetical protein R6Q57_020509 [Mikania cordata]
MLSTQKYALSINKHFLLPISELKVKKKMNNGKIIRSIVSMVKKHDFPPLKILSQAAVAVLGLGFIDAGYSGDWSRIGVISTENEDFLKVAAFVVVPLCLFIILSISKVVDD